MTTNAGVGMSRHHNPNFAGHDAAEQALKNARISKPDIVFMFATVGYETSTPCCGRCERRLEMHPAPVARHRAR